MKTFLQQFDTVEVPDYDVFHSGCLETDVVENIHTIDELLKEHQMILVNNQHQMVGENVRIITAVRNYYVVLGEDGYKLFRRDGVLLADQIRGFYVFHAGWIMVSFDDTVSLYRDDATLAYHKKGQIEYIPFPDKLKGRYQAFTQADLTNLRAAGYDKPFKTVAEGVTEYMAWLNRDA